MFHNARLTLTSWYLLIIMCISISFSTVIYSVLSREIERFSDSQRLRIERQLNEGVLFRQPRSTNGGAFPPIFDPELVNDVKRRVGFILVFVNCGIFIIAGGLGYFLSGRTLRPIQDMLDEQNRFISDASHELRTPLTSLKTSMEVAIRDKQFTVKDAKILIKDSIDEVNRLQSLSDELLQLAQFEKPNVPGSIMAVSLAGIIGRAVKKMEPLALAKHMTLKTNIKDITIEGNGYSLTDVFVILLDNAIKYGKKETDISIVSKQNDGIVCVAITDKGIGISEDDIPHLFDRFFRADSARTKTDVGGYGLGLPIAKQIVTTHHGSIAVDSTVGKGSTFTVTLPLKQG